MKYNNQPDKGCECYWHTEKSRWQIFDALDPAARAALNYSLECWCTHCFARTLHADLPRPTERIVSQIAYADRRELAERRRGWRTAIGLYAGNVPAQYPAAPRVPRGKGARPG